MMIYGSPITGEMYDMSNPPRKADGSEMTEGEWRITNEKRAMDLEEANWYKFYKAIDDDNMEHAVNTFQNYGFANVEDIHDANVEWYVHAIELGMSAKEIEEAVPGAELYKDEASKRYLQGMEDEFGAGVESISVPDDGLSQ